MRGTSTGGPARGASGLWGPTARQSQDGLDLAPQQGVDRVAARGAVPEAPPPSRRRCWRQTRHRSTPSTEQARSAVYPAATHSEMRASSSPFTSPGTRAGGSGRSAPGRLSRTGTGPARPLGSSSDSWGFRPETCRLQSGIRLAAPRPLPQSRKRVRVCRERPFEVVGARQLNWRCFGALIRQLSVFVPTKKVSCDLVI